MIGRPRVVGARRPHVEREALLVLDEVGALELRAPDLRRDRAEVGARRGRSPSVDGHRWREAPGGRVRDAAEHRDPVVPRAAHRVAVQVHQRCGVHAAPRS